MSLNTTFKVDKELYYEDIFASIIDRMNVNLTKKGIMNVGFMFGSIKEILNNIENITENRSVSRYKYPLIALITNAVEKEVRDTNIFSEVRLNFIIIMNTDKDLKATERLEKNFKKVLIPIYREFLYQIKINPLFYNGEGIVQHDKTRDYNLGRYNLKEVDGIKLNDYLDAILIDNMEIKIKSF